MVITTAPTWTQVEKLLWGHIHKAADTGRLHFPRLFKTELAIGPSNYAIGLSTNEGVRFQGWHGRILVILDEAPGVIPSIWEAIEGIRAGGDVRVLALGQAMTLAGPFYDAFHGHRQTWNTITISAFDTPNLAGVCLDNGKSGSEHIRHGSQDPAAPNLLEMNEDELSRNPRPYLTTRRWVRDAWFDWGVTGSPLWEVKVLGQFPKQSEDSLLSLDMLEAAEEIIPGYEAEPLRAGVDVAGPGDAETVVSVRQGPNRIAAKAWVKPDPRGEVLEFLQPYKPYLELVNVDTIGMGYYFALHLEDHGFPVRHVNIESTEGIDREKYQDQKASYFWNLRERAMERRLGGIDNKREQAQLLSVRYFHDSSGRIGIVSKEKLAKLGIPSPDWAEADMLAYAPDPTVAEERLSYSTAYYSG